jgi:hypothetical protein
LKLPADGILRCPNCELKFFAEGYMIDASKRITKCPMCDEMIKIDPIKPMKSEEPEIYYLVTYSQFVKGDSLANATWVTRDEAFGGYVWKNMIGGKCPCDDNDRIHEVTMADDVMDLDWKKTYMYAGLKEDFYTGWLSPNGEFVQSARNMFENTANFIIGKSPERLKSEKWLRLDRLGKDPYFTPRNLVTRKQYHWLKEHDYEGVDMEDFE